MKENASQYHKIHFFMFIGFRRQLWRFEYVNLD